MSITRSMHKKRKTSLPDYNVSSHKESRPRTNTNMAFQNGSVTTKTQPAVSSPVQSSTIQHGQLQMFNGVFEGDQPFNMNQLSQYTHQLMAMNSTSPVFPTHKPFTSVNINTQPNMDICGMLTMLIHNVDIMESKQTQLDAI